MRKSVNSLINTRKDIIQFLSSNNDMSGLFNLPTTISKDRIALFKDSYYNIGNTPLHRIKLSNRVYEQITH